MAQASSSQPLTHWLNWVRRLDRQALRRLSRFRGPGGWLMALTLIVALWMWNWPLVLATLAGLLSMLVAYWVQHYRWQSAIWQTLWSRSNRPLTISVFAGGLATLSTYMATMVWLAADNGWLAMGTVLQGLGTLAIGLLLLRQIWGRSTPPVNEIQMLSRLSTENSLDRLIAIRQVTAWAITVQPTLQAQVADCFRLMLQQESDSILQAALFDGLQALMPKIPDTAAGRDRLSTGEPPVAIPLAPLTEDWAVRVEVKKW